MVSVVTSRKGEFPVCSPSLPVPLLTSSFSLSQVAFNSLVTMGEQGAKGQVTVLDGQIEDSLPLNPPRAFLDR